MGDMKELSELEERGGSGGGERGGDVWFSFVTIMVWHFAERENVYLRRRGLGLYVGGILSGTGVGGTVFEVINVFPAAFASFPFTIRLMHFCCHAFVIHPFAFRR